MLFVFLHLKGSLVSYKRRLFKANKPVLRILILVSMELALTLNEYSTKPDFNFIKKPIPLKEEWTKAKTKFILLLSVEVTDSNLNIIKAITLLGYTLETTIKLGLSIDIHL